MTEENVSYKRINLKCGLEIHQQLETKHKLFCNCATTMQEREPVAVIKRKQHPVASELGTVDAAANYEYFRDRTFFYQSFANENCLVELDEEPPHQLNPEALRTALEIALLLHCEIPNEIQIMRKTVIDGSNTTGFQRTAIIGLNGFLRYKGKKIPINLIALEEDAAAKVKEDGNDVTYRLNRLSVPLIEISTGIIKGFEPEDVQEIAYLIGMTARSTNKVKHGIGTIRQDVNVSIHGGERVEVKGVQELGLISKVIQLEVQRQLSLPKVEEETRAANPDGTTRFTRPLPGEARMYPETDIEPVAVDEQAVEELRKNLPEPLTKRLSRYQSRLKLSTDLAKQILRSDYLETFEKVVAIKGVNPSVAANVFSNTLKDLEKREKVPIDSLTDADFIALFEQLAKERIVKEAIPEILKSIAKVPGKKVEDVIDELNLQMISRSELDNIVSEIVRRNPEMPKEKVIGIVMSNVRGRADAQDVVKAVGRYKRK